MHVQIKHSQVCFLQDIIPNQIYITSCYILFIKYYVAAIVCTGLSSHAWSVIYALTYLLACQTIMDI